jgi:hypothetical protein
MKLLNVLTGLNWLAVASAAPASFVLGGLWFAVLFAKPYAFALGRENQAPHKPTPLELVGPLLCGTVATLTSAVLLQALHLETVSEALAFGLVVGVGYLASTTVNTAINPNMPRPLRYGLVSGGYFALSGVLVSVILVSLK